jgi:hypothetical protein
VGFVVDKAALGQVLSELPMPIFIPQISPQSPSPIIRGWYNRPVVAAVPKVPPHKLKKNLEIDFQNSMNHCIKIVMKVGT